VTYLWPVRELNPPRFLIVRESWHLAGWTIAARSLLRVGGAGASVYVGMGEHVLARVRPPDVFV
jgi:hypothetical protein